MTKPRSLSKEAQEASTPLELWQLFFTDEMIELIVLHTNEKILEEQEERQFSAERLQKSPYIKPVDKVKQSFASL
jgi:hypothetical protein